MFSIFRKITEWAFTSFNISEDAKLLKFLKDSHIENAIIIKRAPIFGYFISWRMILILLLTAGNIYLLFQFLGYTNIGYSITIIYGLCFFIWGLIALRYLTVFNRVYGKENKIISVTPLIEYLENEDGAFGMFFNQAVVSYFCLIGLAIFSIFILFSRTVQLDNWIFLLGIIPIIIVQLLLSGKYIKRMIDLEMDFNVVVPGKIYFHNQKRLWGMNQTLEADKIKTINSRMDGMLQSFFGFGDITIFTEGVEAESGEMHMFFIKNPKETVDEIYKLIDGKNEINIETIDELLERVHTEETANNCVSPETKKDIHAFLSEHDSVIKQLFEMSDEKTKSSIKELYFHIEK